MIKSLSLLTRRPELTHDEFVPFMADVVKEQDAFFKEYGISKMDD